MRIVYTIINFALLAFIVWFFGRKAIAKIFSSRKNLVNAQVDQAEKLEKENAEFSIPEQKMDIPDYEELAGHRIDEIEKELAQKLAYIDEETAALKTSMRKEMLAELKDELVVELKKSVRRLLQSEPYVTALRTRQNLFSGKITDLIRLTPGDMAYLKTKDVLYVTLTSAYPLDEAIIKDIQTKTSELLASVGGKSSFWVKENPRLLGGFELKIGDTVYGCSADDELYYLGSTLRKSAVNGTETAQDLLEEVSEILNELNFSVRTYQRGRVLSVSDGICWMEGLADIMYGEVVEFTGGIRGMVLDIKQDRVGCVIYGNYEKIESGTTVRRVGRIAAVPVGDQLLGRVVDPMGNPIDGRGRTWASEKRPIEYPAPGIPDRKSVSRPLHTGIKAVDAMVPIGRGQRELIIGDRQTGKSAIAVDTIIAQKGKNTPCIYVAIGQKESTVAKICAKLQEYGAMDYTTIVSAPASSSAAMQYIAPFAGTAMAEYFMYTGRDALIIYDDLSKHAVAYRELSLLLHRPAGREAYPGDVFYLHSRLLERSAQLADELGGGSMTALPLVETQAGDIAAYIPTNVISITDGQIFLESQLFNEGQRPAVNVGLSVSRVGGAAQTKLMKQTASLLRMKLAQYRELASFAQFGTDLDSASKDTLAQGALMMAALRQPRFCPLEDWQEAVVLFAAQGEYVKGLDPADMERFESELLGYIDSAYPQLADVLRTGNKLSNQTREQLSSALVKFRESGFNV